MPPGTVCPLSPGGVCPDLGRREPRRAAGGSLADGVWSLENYVVIQ